MAPPDLTRLIPIAKRLDPNRDGTITRDELAELKRGIEWEKRRIKTEGEEPAWVAEQVRQNLADITTLEENAPFEGGVWKYFRGGDLNKNGRVDLDTNQEHVVSADGIPFVYDGSEPERSPDGITTLDELMSYNNDWVRFSRLYQEVRRREKFEYRPHVIDRGKGIAELRFRDDPKLQAIFHHGDYRVIVDCAGIREAQNYRRLLQMAGITETPAADGIGTRFVKGGRPLSDFDAYSDLQRVRFTQSELPIVVPSMGEAEGAEVRRLMEQQGIVPLRVTHGVADPTQRLLEVYHRPTHSFQSIPVPKGGETPFLDSLRAWAASR